MRRARQRVVISLFVTITSAAAGCLIDRGNLQVAARRDAGPTDAPLGDVGDVGDAASECGPGQTSCAEGCVDLSSDPTHCGDCAIACDEGQACVESRCEGCTTTVYGVCAANLRVWLDARDPNGDGSTPAAGTSLARWVNRARDAAGDAMPVLGAATLEDGAGARRVVRLAGTRLETTDVVSADAEHAEIFLVARSRTLDSGVTLALDGAAPLVVQLPGDKSFVFGLPVGEATMTGPFGRDDRHTTLWHAFGGPSGREVRIDGTVVLRGEAGLAASLAAPLSLGGDATGTTQAVDVSELLVFDAPLSNPERSAITAALLERWGLGSPATPSTDALSLWLDAREPLSDSDPVDGASLVRWDDRSPRATMAAATGVTWRASGLGAGRPAVELGPGGTESHVSFPRPVSADFTALLVFATEDGTREGLGHQRATVIGADAESALDDGALLLGGGHVSFGREPGSPPSSSARYDDGLPHTVVVRRRSSGNVQIWVDHERVLDVATLAGAVSSPASWFLGRGPDPTWGALAARYGEVLVYSRALEDEELSTAERYLVRRWSTAVVGRAPRLTPCTLGREMACPYASFDALRALGTGRYWLDVGAGPMRVSVDDAEGGGWVLVLQYVHAATTNPGLDAIRIGADWPEQSSTALGGADRVRSARWGHLSQPAAALFASATELRWEGRTDAHPRVVHFRSPVGVDGWRRGVNDFAAMPAMFVPLTGHDARLPATATGFGVVVTPDTVLTSFPMYERSAIVGDWAIRGIETRWAVDDFDGRGYASATIHRVWAR